jgi:hypothetical protein
MVTVMTGSDTEEPAAASLSTPFAQASSLFQFVQTRAPQPGGSERTEKLPRVKAYFAEDPTAFHSGLAALRAGGDPEGMLNEARDFVESEDRRPWGGSRFRGRPDSLPDWLTKLDAALIARHDRPAVSRLESVLLRVLRETDAFVPDERFQWDRFADSLRATWRDVSDSIIAVSLWPGASASSQANLARAMRVLALVNRIVDTGWRVPAEHDKDPEPSLSYELASEQVETTLVDGLVLLPPEVFIAERSASGNGRPGIGRREPVEERRGETLEEVASDAPTHRSALRRGVSALSQALRVAMHHEESSVPEMGEVMPFLPRETAALVRSLEIPEEEPVTRAMEMLDGMARGSSDGGSSDGAAEAVATERSAAALSIIERPPVFGEQLALNGWRQTLGDWEVGNLTRAPIVGDLHVVRQELLRYEAGEIADIENLMAKEKKGHIHVFKELREQETVTAEEHEEEHTHDNQTTDRNEMERESKKESQSEASIEAGVTFSAQYGPVKIGANTQASYAASSSESNKVASKYAKEVIDRTIDRVKDRRLEQRRVLMRQETVDRNVHEYDNDGDASVVGIYQWVDKIYEAATFNYGRRMMLDVTIPEPASYWQYAKVLDAAAGVNAKPPPPLKITDPDTGVRRDLAADDIGEVIQVGELAATYRVAGLTPPPPRWTTVGKALKTEGDPATDEWAKDLQHIATKTETLKIPKGYEPAWYTGVVNLLANTHENYGVMSGAWRNEYSSIIGYGPDGTNLPFKTAYEGGIMGNNTLSVGPFIDPVQLGIPSTVSHAFVEAHPDNTVAAGATGDVGEEGEIPVTFTALGSPVFTAAVTVVCERTEQAYRKWQLEQYQAVVTHWEQWTADFESAVREAKAAADLKNTPSTSTNTALSGRVITDELRRQFLEMLRVPYLGNTVGMKPADLSDPTKPQPPALDPPRAAVEGRVIEFVEQAFEWPQMAYHFYPYYWKRRAAWPNSMVLQDADPAFTDFLRAGSARVVVPVRPGFELAVCHHLGVRPIIPWRAGTPPIVDAEPYISIAEEIKSSQTSLEKPARIDKPWPVKLPTTLVILRDAVEELPVYRLPTPDDDTP